MAEARPVDATQIGAPERTMGRSAALYAVAAAKHLAEAVQYRSLIGTTGLSAGRGTRVAAPLAVFSAVIIRSSRVGHQHEPRSGVLSIAGQNLTRQDFSRDGPERSGPPTVSSKWNNRGLGRRRRERSSIAG